MRRLLVQLWGTNGSEYIGRNLTIARDESVKWAGSEVGGIVITHASHIDAPKRLAITVSRGQKKSMTVTPLNYVQPSNDSILSKLKECKTLKELGEAWSSLKPVEQKIKEVFELKESLKTTLI